jgi:hypothetical protein
VTINPTRTILAVLLALAGCSKKPDVSKMKDQATALAAKYSPQLSDLSKKLPDLTKNAKGVPGADKLNKLLADNQGTVSSAQDFLNKLPEKIAKDSPEQAKKDLAEADKLLADDVAKAKEDEKEEGDLEAGPASAPATAPVVTPASAPVSSKK